MPDIEVTVSHGSAAEARTPLLALPLFESDAEPVGPAAEADRSLNGLLGRVLRRGDFRAKKGETLVLYPAGEEGGLERVLLVGAGKREDYALEGLREAVGTAVRQAEKLGVDRLSIALGHTEKLSEHMGPYHAARGAAEGAVLAAWDFRELKTQREEDAPRAALQTVELLSAADAKELRRGCRDGVIVARAENLARQLAARPGNVATPEHLAETARGLGERLGLQVTVFDRAALEAEGMHALLAVARGSEEEPRFIVLEYRGGEADSPALALIGKGVTFDSGGISIKPAEKMEQMKYDMAGAAAVLGALQAVAELGLRANVVGLIPATENLPSGRALKPGDVIRTHLGKTVEVINTDAEGRLILADALSYARRFSPAAMVDAATLTGACVIALGHHASALMGNDGGLIDEVRMAGERTGERCWPLPLWDEYRPQLDSKVADIQNTGGRPAGSITAGWFLKEFVGETPWVHLDIAGTAWRDEVPAYLRKGPTGVPTRIFIEWVRARTEG